MQALLQQLSFELERFHVAEKQIETLFIGGGTPSTIAPELYAPLFELLSPYLAEDAEITTEANPNSATEAWLSGMYRLGVNRVSFGVQSFHAEKLKALNRAHTPTEAKEALLTAAAIGFRHLSLDLIYNYAGDTKTLLKQDIETAFSLPIDHLSAYELTIEQGTTFSSTPEVRQEDESLAFFVAEEIVKHGFPQYEISNFGSYESRHNKGYWEQKAYIGAGAGAVGFLKNTRYYPQTDIDAYIQDPLKVTKEHLDHQARLTESLFLGLRSNVGIAKKILTAPMKERAALLLEEKRLVENETHLYNRNFFIADALALYLLD
jgi:oxygen-independent coproporphyrinogen-3 oxidase